MKQLKKVVTMILVLVLVTGLFTCIAGSGEVQAASKALINARKKAETSLIKTFDTLDNTKPYTEANYKKLISVKETGIKKINAAKSKKAVSKALKKYVSDLKAVKYMQPTDSTKICLGENGVVAWKVVKGAVKYNVEFQEWRDCPVYVRDEEITETYVKLGIGDRVWVTPIMSNGRKGDNLLSDYYKKDQVDLAHGFTDVEPEVNESKLLTWNAFKKIDTKSVKKKKDGSVYFETQGPNGEKISFWGEDIDVKKDGIILHKKGRIVMTDAFGKIYDVRPVVRSSGSSDNWLTIFTGFNIDYDMHPKTIDRMIYGSGAGRYARDYTQTGINVGAYEANFVGIGFASPEYEADHESGNKGDIEISDIVIKYIPAKKATRLRGLVLSPFKYSPYMSGELYDMSKEIYEPYNGQGYFHLLALPDLDNDKNEVPIVTDDFYKIWPYAISASYGECYSIGNLKDSNGKEYNRNGGKVTEGTTLTVYLGEEEFDVPLNVIGVYEGAQTMHDLLPYANPKAAGNKKILVIPIVWQDDKKPANKKNIELLKKRLGKAAKLGENIKDYSENNEKNGFSLSSYFETASYGKLKLESYITDWYTAPYNFDEMESCQISRQFIDEVLKWLYKKYPDVDFSVFDPDGNGYFDHIMFLNYGDMSSRDSYTRIGFGGATDYRSTYGGEFAGTAQKPGINRVLNSNASSFVLNSNVMIHEFSHGLGLIDYYDVTGSGFDAVGCYDMQSSNVGDWNAYSKYAVGWIKPEVVTGLKKGESKEIEIGAFSDTGNAIVIPIAGDKLEPPFSEYMLVDLYTSTGVNKYDSIAFDLNDFEGVRIYHVDAKMERRDFRNSDYPDIETTPIGTIHIANDYKPDGRYNLELIQAGAENTFTSYPIRTRLAQEDFFQAGDTFTLDKYSAFFKDGLMDYADDFGYEIEIVSITGTGSDAKAKIRITRQ